MIFEFLKHLHGQFLEGSCDSRFSPFPLIGERELNGKLSNLTLTNLFNNANFFSSQNSLFFLLKRGKLCPQLCVTCFIQAAKSGKLHIVRKKVEKQQCNMKQYVNMKDERNTTALHYAVLFNHIDIVKYLIEKGASMFFNFHIFCVRVVPIPVHLCNVCRCSIVFVLNYSSFSYLCMLTVCLLEH